jgi:hypothetical protein
MSRLTSEELHLVDLKRDLCSKPNDHRLAVLNAFHYLEQHGTYGENSISAINLISPVILAYVAGELDWVKDLESDVG